GPAKCLALDDGDASTRAGEALGERRAGLTTADDDGVIGCHRCSLRRRPLGGITMTGLRPPVPMLLADPFDAASTFRRLRAPTPARRDIAQSADTALPWNVVGV